MSSKVSLSDSQSFTTNIPKPILPKNGLVIALRIASAVAAVFTVSSFMAIPAAGTISFASWSLIKGGFGSLVFYDALKCSENINQDDLADEKTCLLKPLNEFLSNAYEKAANLFFDLFYNTIQFNSQQERANILNRKDTENALLRSQLLRNS